MSDPIDHDVAESVVLTTEQASRLARVLIGRHLSGDLDWLVWEDVPYLDEASFCAVWEAIQYEGNLMFQGVRREDTSTGRDTLYLLESAQHGPVRMRGDQR